MPWRIPDSILDRTRAWEQHNDQVAFEIAFQSGDQEERLMAQALMCASPETPEKFFRGMVNNTTAPRSGYPAIPPTLEDVFAMSTGLPGDNSLQKQAGAH